MRRCQGGAHDLPPEVVEQVEFSLKYEGYIDREWRQIEKSEQVAKQRIPDGFDYHAIGALRYESREKLSAIRPRDLGQAARISGVTPADISILSVWLKKIQSRLGSRSRSLDIFPHIIRYPYDRYICVDSQSIIIIICESYSMMIIISLIIILIIDYRT